jgi:Subtilase family
VDTPRRLRHLRVDAWAKTELYTAPPGGRGSFDMPPRDRIPHGNNVLEQIRQATTDNIEYQKGLGPEDAIRGNFLIFESSPEHDLALKQLEAERSGIELVCVRSINTVMHAVVFVPNGKLKHFITRITDYLTKAKKHGEPKHQELIDSINAIRSAALESFWMEPGNVPFPASGTIVAWEVWLRVAGKRKPDQVIATFRQEAMGLGLQVSQRSILFRDRAVVLVNGTRDQLESSLEILNVIGELRLAKECPTSFVQMTPREQAEWSEDALRRVTAPQVDAAATCILDTGVSLGHPLLDLALQPTLALTCFPGQNPHDHDGHGTEMAGIALYGDLTEVLGTSLPVVLTHHLESVKILPPVGANHPDLYGSITREAVGRIETASPSRKRIFSMAVTALDSRDQGQPSSWSGELDLLSFGEEESPRRLFVVSAGNVALDTHHLYPDANHTDGIHDPGQAWNIITVGAYTERATIRSTDFDGWRPIAVPGALSPCSTTSLLWEHDWPLKPDVVAEGGNSALNPSGTSADVIDDLSLLTTARQQSGRLFVSTGDTSAATSLVARTAANIQSEYPAYWPETVRGLVIHSAEWTPHMQKEFRKGSKGERTKTRLRCYGYGVPDLGRSLWCARNALCLVAQAELQPYRKVKSDIKTNEMHFYELPWPIAQLQELDEELVRMRVTLSYFIEPSPGRRGWNYRHRYMSHGLRFKVKLPTESMHEFKQRINRLAREEGEDVESADEARKWGLGWKLRNRGSVQSDWWEGTASDLAMCGALGVFPVTGWWRERPHLRCWSKKARYSLIVSINTPATTTDIYSPVQNAISIVTPIETDGV